MLPTSENSKFNLDGADVIVSGVLDADVGPVTVTVEISATDDGTPALTTATNTVVTITITGICFYFTMA